MICNKCHIDKEIKDFPKRSDTKKGIRGSCKTCTGKRMREWWANNKEERLEYAQKWYANNREKVISQKVSSNLKMRRLARLDCIEHYSGGKNCCECCGEKNLEFFAIDHIAGGGKKDRELAKDYLPLVLKRKKYPKGYRILCHNCNMSLGFYGYCPHKK